MVAPTKPGEITEPNTDSYIAPTDASAKGGRPRGLPALFSKAEITEIANEAYELQDPSMLIDWAKKNSLVWLVVLNSLVFKARGPSAVAQVAGVIEKLIKNTSKILEVPRERPVPDPTPGENNLEESPEPAGDDYESIGALLEDASQLLAGD